MPRKTPDEIFELHYECNPDLQAQVKALQIVRNLANSKKIEKIEKAG